MRGSIQVSRRYCDYCDQLSKFERNSAVYGVGDLVLVVFSFGTWLILKYLIRHVFNPWRCTECGSTEAKRLQEA